MEKKKKTKSKKNKQFVRPKQYHSLENIEILEEPTEEHKDFKYYSCKNITTFAPKILPKKSFCKPSFFILNPEEKFKKKLSQKDFEYNLVIYKESHSSENSSDLDSLSEEKKDENQKDELNSKKDSDINVINNINNEIISKDNSINENCLSIFDVLSMNNKL